MKKRVVVVCGVWCVVCGVVVVCGGVWCGGGVVVVMCRC